MYILNGNKKPATERRFEDRIVAWLLKRYDIYDTRTRFMLLDVEEKYFRASDLECVQQQLSPIRLLSLRAFYHFFPDFPILLRASCMNKTQWARLTIDKVMTKLESTLLVHQYAMFQDPEEVSDGIQPLAVIHKTPYQRSLANSVVLHNCAPVDDRIPGPHFAYRFKQGGVIYLETLGGFFACFDLKHAASKWIDSAIDPDFRDPVPVGP